MITVGTPEEARIAAAGRGIVGLVPTMGYLHEGHLSLVEAARKRCDVVMMSVFVNPLQFNNPDDLARYPRDLERDAALAIGAGVDIFYAPGADVVYPRPPLTTVTVGEVTDEMEGAHRPGHFEGVATVVAKLFASLQPDLAFFGRKDHQQLVMIRRMAADLSFPVDVVPCPTMREPDGLALSSRNVLIEDRSKALSVSQALFAAADAIAAGERDPGVIEKLAADRLRLDSVDYVTLASQSGAQRVDRLDEPAFLAVAGMCGRVRLIDNVAIDVADGVFVVDRGRRLASASELARP